MGTVQDEHIFPLRVASYDVGEDDRLRLSAVLRYQQEAAERHFEPAGLGWDGQIARGFAFVLTRWHALFLRLPAMGEQTAVTTWHRERRGARFYRCHVWHDAAGQELIRSVTEYALVSVSDHRLLRGDEFDELGIAQHPERRIDLADPGRLRLPPLDPAGEYTVRRSDLDRNGHMNNTRYADLCTDLLPDGLPPVREIWLHFAGETRRGYRIVLERATEEDGFFARGATAHGEAFEARLLTGAEDADGVR